MTQPRSTGQRRNPATTLDYDIVFRDLRAELSRQAKLMQRLEKRTYSIEKELNHLIQVISQSNLKQ